MGVDTLIFGFLGVLAQIVGIPTLIVVLIVLGLAGSAVSYFLPDKRHQKSMKNLKLISWGANWISTQQISACHGEAIAVIRSQPLGRMNKSRYLVSRLLFDSKTS